MKKGPDRRLWGAVTVWRMYTSIPLCSGGETRALGRRELVAELYGDINNTVL